MMIICLMLLASAELRISKNQNYQQSLKPSTSGLVAKYVAVNFVFLKPTNKASNYI